MASNVGRIFIETIVVELVSKNIIFNKPTAHGLDSYFIINAKWNSEVTDTTSTNKNVDSSSNISSNINKSSSNENKEVADNISPPLSHNINTPISALKIHVKCELSTLANKTKTMSLNLWKTVYAQQVSVNKNVESLLQNISYL